MDTLSSLLQEIVAGQERHASKATHYDQAVKFFQERFRFGLNSMQEMGMITLFAESSLAVKQFLAFSEEQRDIFVQQKVAAM
jgi:putative heme iron utilization protein